MPSFDIVSKTDLAEVDNALANIEREIETRFDFKGSHCKIERKDETLTVHADDPLKLKQIHELIKTISPGARSIPARWSSRIRRRPRADTVRQTIIVKQGVDKDLAKKLVKEIKDSKLKVQVAIQGDELRVSGKKRDDLQEAIQHIKGMKIELPLQYVNFRE
ncbi:MAG: YajQ family cyclic di-GMP-binding protein [Aliidongia sp.]